MFDPQNVQAAHMLAFQLKTIYFVCSLIVIAAWFFAYFKTKAVGFALIGLAGVIGYTGSTIIPFIVVFLKVNMMLSVYLVYILPVIRTAALILIFFGILSLLKTVSTGQTAASSNFK